MVDTLKAAAESSRLRILLLLARGDLTVSDLTEILGQSQPRVSRHLKLLVEAGLIERYQEGAWAYFRLVDAEPVMEFVAAVAARISASDATVERDRERLDMVKARRQARAAEYFRANARRWDEIRSLHVPDDRVETALLESLGDRPFRAMLDLGTGTGRMLELLAPLYHRGVGIDLSREMLAVARANLDRAGISHAQVRLGDIYALPLERQSFDLVTIHQVLHYLEEPGLALAEAARMLRPGGRLVVVDFAPHSLEFLREQHAHVRLGFSDAQMSEWFREAGLEPLQTLAFVHHSPNSDRLTVKLWLAHDPRMLVADNGAKTALPRETA
jgi:ArsR family transcriptional regulator